MLFHAAKVAQHHVVTKPKNVSLAVSCSLKKTISLCITVEVHLISARIITAMLLLEDYFPFQMLLKNGS